VIRRSRGSGSPEGGGVALLLLLLPLDRGSHAISPPSKGHFCGLDQKAPGAG